MSSALETLSIQELYTRKDNLFKQINKVDEEIKRKGKEKELLDDTLSETLSEEIKLPKKIILKKVKKVSDNLYADGLSCKQNRSRVVRIEIVLSCLEIKFHSYLVSPPSE